MLSNFNLIDMIFINFVLVMVVFSTLINLSESKLPTIILQTFRYGKHAYNGIPSTFVSQCEIPKAYFKHFYAFAIVWSSLVFGLATSVYAFGMPAPKWIVSALDLLCGTNRSVSASPLATYLAVSLLFLQCIRRFYETHWVQVFSSHSKINISHYAVGYFHYFGAFLVIIAHGPGFVNHGIDLEHSMKISPNQLTAMQCGAVALFLFAWYNQFQSNLILANLRKNKTGAVLNHKHHLPSGGYFNLVSAPHMFFEIILYIAIQLLLPTNTSWIFVLLWVVSNQIENAWLTHKWYTQNFEDFSKLNRRAIIPYLL